MGELGVLLGAAERIASVSAPVLLALALLGGLLGWWVPGWAYRQLLQERNEWKRRALSGTELAETVGGRLVAERRRRREEHAD